jgi:hypothetical protein
LPQQIEQGRCVDVQHGKGRCVHSSNVQYGKGGCVDVQHVKGRCVDVQHRKGRCVDVQHGKGRCVHSSNVQQRGACYIRNVWIARSGGHGGRLVGGEEDALIV